MTKALEQNRGFREVIFCHVCKEEIEICNNMASEDEEPICPDCEDRISNQDNFSSSDDLQCYQQYGWKYEK